MLFRTIIFMAVLFIFVVVAQSELRIGGNHDFEYVSIRNLYRMIKKNDWCEGFKRLERKI